MTKLLSKNYFYYACILIAVCFIYFQLSFLIYVQKWDITNQTLPWRYYIGECLRNGYLPLWCPYANLGWPIHVDPQTWYPIAWFFTIIKQYNFSSVSYEFLFHVYVAGIGMFKLCEAYCKKKPIAFIMSIAYCCGGFFAGQAQHLGWIVSATYLPFVIYYLFKLGDSENLDSTFKLSLFSFLMLSGGYPAFILVTFYLVLIYSIYLFVVKKNRTQYFLTYSKRLALTTVIIYCCAAVIIVSGMDTFDYLTRGAGLDLSAANFGAFTPQSALSFLYPFSTVKNAEIFNTDLSLTNGYIGLIPLSGLILFLLFNKKTSLEWFLLAFAFFTLLNSFGEYTFIRALTYKYFPGFNYFRLPSFFRLFSMMIFIFLSSKSIANAIENSATSKKLKWILILLNSINFFVLLYFSFKNIDYYTTLSLESFDNRLNESFDQRIFTNSFYALIISGSCLLALSFVKQKQLIFVFCLISMFDLFINLQLVAPVTIYSQHHSAKSANASFEKFPAQFPLPSEKVSAVIDDENIGTTGKNINIFKKRVACDGINPFIIKHIEHLTDSFPNFSKVAMNNKVLFASNEIIKSSTLQKCYSDSSYNSLSLFIEDGEVSNFNLDTSLQNNADIFLSLFNPGEIKANLKLKKQTCITLLQNYYPGWIATIDNIPTKIFISNFTFMSIIVPKEAKEIKFSYQPKYLKFAFYLSAITFLGLVLVIAYLEYAKVFKINRK